MSTPTRLLAATDFSVFGGYAVNRAALIAKEPGASLDLLHVTTLAPLESIGLVVVQTHPGLEQSALDVAREKLRQAGEAILETTLPKTRLPRCCFERSPKA